MAGLAELYENPWVNTAIGFTPVLGDVQSGYETANSLRKGNYGEAALNAIGLLPYVPSLGKLAAAKGMAGMMMPFAGAIKASHGSPHQFDAFDFSKIGSGEGAQAFGHGGYFAQGFDSPVAKGYRASTSQGFGLPDGDTQGIAMLIAARGDKGEAMARRHYANLGDALEPTIEDAKKAIDENSYLYNVSLQWPDAAREAADPLGEHHLLDWDAPLSEQPSLVRQALEVIDPDTYHPEGFDYDPTELGQSIYHRLANSKRDYAITANKPQDTTLKGMQSAASRELAELGIPGIRYLDQASRGAGEGTRNFVIFNDQIPKIVSRNGQPVGLAGMLEEGR